MAGALAVAAQGRERARCARFADRVRGKLGHGLINFHIVTHKRLKLNDHKSKPSDEISGSDLDSPAENLACDEALLDLCEESGVEILRFWESHQYFVVVRLREQGRERSKCRGMSSPFDSDSAPVQWRRHGGARTRMFELRSHPAPSRERPPATTITGTNQLVMERNRMAMEKLLGVPVAVKRHTSGVYA